MSVFMPDSQLAAEVHFVVIFLLAGAFLVWFLGTNKLDKWVPLIGTMTTALQLLGWAILVGYGWTAA